MIFFFLIEVSLFSKYRILEAKIAFGKNLQKKSLLKWDILSSSLPKNATNK